MKTIPPETSRCLGKLKIALLVGICTVLVAATTTLAQEKEKPKPTAAPPQIKPIDISQLDPSAIISAVERSPKLAEFLKKKQPESVTDLKILQDQVRKVSKRVMSATVGIQIGSSQGSGVIISEDGYVLTAGHVSEKAGLTATLILEDGKRIKGKTLGLNRGIDSGLIKITTKGKWPFIPMALSDELESGQWVVATGHPNGYVRGRRPVVRLGRVLFANENVICTDCTLVGGDSGGPLFNLDGQVVGIHSRIGLQITTNFHVPISTYHNTWDRLAASEVWGGRSAGSESANARPLVGISGNPSVSPCRVNQVFPNSPADRAGIQVGDIILKFAGTEVHSFAELAEQVRLKKPGDPVSVVLNRGEKELLLKFRLTGLSRPLPGGDETPLPKKKE